MDDVKKDTEKKPKERKRRAKSKSNKFYVPPAEFLADLKEYYHTDVISIRLAESINKIVEGLSYAPNFINYSFKEEMCGDARVKMAAALKFKKFDIKSTYNPFSYFTTIAFHAFINRIKKEKKHHQTICDYQEKVYTDLLTSGEGAGSRNIYVDPYSGNEHDD